ncbi:MAG: DUF2164 family protein [Bacillota bacterium]
MKKIKLDKETVQLMVEEVKQFFLEQRDEELSDFQARVFVEFILSKAGFHIYNQAIQDAHDYMVERVEDMYGLEKRQR